MNKTKIPFATIIKYLRDFSIVVAGIAVTLYVNDRVTYRSEKRDLALYLNAVKLELEENVNDIDELVASMQKSIGYADYLRSHDKKSLHTDTIMSYARNGIYLIQGITFKVNAFEMLKLSGTMRLLEDKELLLAVWKAYTDLDELHTVLEMGYQMKMEEMKKELYLPPREREKTIPMYIYYTATEWVYELPRVCGEASEMLKRTVEKLEKVL
jgi:hypothetical protein